MDEVKELAEATLTRMVGCPRKGDCLARRFVEKRLIESIDLGDDGAIWHWTTHAVGEIDSCDLDCPGKDPVVRLIGRLHAKIRS